MDVLIDSVMDNINEPLAREQVDELLEMDYFVDEIKEDIKSVRPHISFWDKLNVFSKTEAERDMKHFQDELKAQRELREKVLDALKTTIVQAIGDTYAVRLKIQLASLREKAESIRATQSGAASNCRCSVKGKNKLIKMLQQVDSEFSEQFNFMPGPIDEDELIGGVISRLVQQAT